MMMSHRIRVRPPAEAGVRTPESGVSPNFGTRLTRVGSQLLLSIPAKTLEKAIRPMIATRLLLKFKKHTFFTLFPHFFHTFSTLFPQFFQKVCLQTFCRLADFFPYTIPLQFSKKEVKPP
jgi:hypothetical protein